MERERGRLIFKRSFTESEGSVVCKKYTVARICRFVFNIFLPSFVFIYKDFQLNVLHRTLCCLVEFSFSLYQAIILYLVNESHLL